MTIRSLPALSPLILAMQVFMLVGGLSLSVAANAAATPATKNVTWGK